MHWHEQNWVSNELFMNLGCVTRTFRTYWSACNMNFERIHQRFGSHTLSNTPIIMYKSRLADDNSTWKGAVICKAARPH